MILKGNFSPFFLFYFKEKIRDRRKSVEGVEKKNEMKRISIILCPDWDNTNRDRNRNINRLSLIV